MKVVFLICKILKLGGHITSDAIALSDLEISHLCWILWLIWKARNDKVFDDRKLSRTYVITG